MRRQITPNPQQLITQVLHDSFYDNRSIEYVIGGGPGKSRKLQHLLSYSYKVGCRFGKVYEVSEGGACAIVLDSAKKKVDLQTVWWDVKLLFQVIGLRNAFNVLKREQQLKKNQPKSRFIHLWYIGVSPERQGSGAGTKLLRQILEEHRSLPIYLETSNPRNFPFYERHGFQLINQLDSLGYSLRVYLKPPQA